MASNDVYSGGTIGDMIVEALNRYPERTAFIDDHGQMTYQELARRISQTISAFEDMGLERGDCVVQLARNRTSVFVVMASAYIMGLRSVTMHGAAGIEDHAHIVNDSEGLIFIADNIYSERLGELKDKCPNVKYWFSHDDDCESAPCFWSYVGKQDSARPLVVTALPDDIVRLAYTGGTTGRPKGVMLSNRSMWMQALLILGGRKLPEDMRFLCPTPISHGAGSMLVPTLWRGGTVILQNKYDPLRFMQALAEHGATLSFLVPTMMYSLMDHPEIKNHDLSSLRLLAYGAAPMAPSRIEEAIRLFGPILSQSYGQTECPSNILYLSPEDHVRTDVNTHGSAGMPYPGVSVALLDSDDKPVARGKIGELCVRSPLIMQGYWKKPELTAEVIRDGWLHTGDMARQDEHGYYFLVDRKKDMIISGGFNVYPKEVEHALSSHPAVASAAVIGVPDEKWGEAVKAFVVLREGEEVTEEELQTFVRDAKGPVNTPKTISILEALPLTTLGKIDKNRLRSPYWDDRTRAIN